MSIPLFLYSEFNATSYRAYFNNLHSYYKTVIKQSEDRNYSVFNGFYLIDFESYKNLEDRESLDGHAIFYVGYIDNFLKISNQRAVTLYTKDNYKLQFPIKIYDNLYYYDRDDPIFAICFLPRFDECLLLGIDYE